MQNQTKRRRRKNNDDTKKIEEKKQEINEYNAQHTNPETIRAVKLHSQFKCIFIKCILKYYELYHQFCVHGFICLDI